MLLDPMYPASTIHQKDCESRNSLNHQWQFPRDERRHSSGSSSTTMPSFVPWKLPLVVQRVPDQKGGLQEADILCYSNQLIQSVSRPDGGPAPGATTTHP